MLKHAAHLVLIVLLVAAGTLSGYEYGRAASNAQNVTAPAGIPIAPTHIASTGLPEFPYTPAPFPALDENAKVTLFSLAEVAYLPLLMIGSAPVSKEDANGSGKFNFNIGYQF